MDQRHIASAVRLAVGLAAALVSGHGAVAQTTSRVGDWPAYGRDPGGTRYAPLAQITPGNVHELRLAWLYRTGDYLRDRGRLEATPLVVDGTLYIATPAGRVIALDPASGTERWSYDAGVDLEGDYGDFANRGVATWFDGDRRGVCRRRVFLATVDARLIALDGRTGRPCADFGAAGTVDLAAGLRHAPAFHGEYGVTSPPAVVRDLIIVGSAVADNQRVDAPEGVVRAFDARSGALRWSWDPIPRTPDTPGYDTWRGPLAHTTGAANAWSVLSADPARDLLFVPVGSGSSDFYGGTRLGANLYSSSVVALRASTGRVVWAFQIVHHDLWDYDVPAQPVLFTLRRGGETIPAVAVGTKMGHLFLLDRRSGKPLTPVEERAVPASDVPGEEAWPTQPFPPAAFRLAPETLSAADAFGVTPEARTQCRDRIATLRYQGVFTPPSLKGTIIFPGNIGGMNWSGVAVDERRGVLIAPTNRLAMIVTLIPRDNLPAARHAHPHAEISPQRGTPFGMMREVLIGPDGVPCNPPPWGALAAVDLSAGRVQWETPLGTLPKLAQVPGSERWGSLNLGGAMVTAGGLIFIAGTYDQHLRAFDEQTGRELWSAALPAGAQALPMTYLAEGRQYVIVSAGGHDRLRTTMGDYVLAFALPVAGKAVGPDTAAAPVAGAYAGQIRVGRARIGLDVTIRAAGDSLAAMVGRIDSLEVAGPVAVRQAGRAVTLGFRFNYPAKRCAGHMTATGEQWNGARLIEGDVEVTGSCGGGPPEPGTFALWRQGRRGT